MKRGEIVVFAIMGLVVAGVLVRNAMTARQEAPDPGIPYYSTATENLTVRGSEIYHREGCKSCHSLWTVRNMMESVPAPALDGIGSLRDQDWFYRYLSAPDPQTILPSRLKLQYRMPSYAGLSEEDRRTLAAYLASLKVKDWYLQETRKAEYEKLTGKEYHP
jgi:cbb3-type cytochrome oxidase cytochrome c subunit